MKYGHTWGPLSFAHLYIITYTLCPIGPTPRCTWTLMLECIAPFGICFCWWKQSAPPSASHLYIRLGVSLGIEQHYCHLTPGKSKPWTLYMATMGGYFWHFCLCALPNPSLVACCLAFPFSLTPKFGLHMSSTTSPATADESIEHYQNYATAAGLQMSLNNLQPLSPSAGVNLWAISNGSAPRQWPNAFSRETQAPILCSTCWMHDSWHAPSIWQIASRRIRSASGCLGVYPQHPLSLRNCCSLHLHRIRG